jgi:insulysin
MIRYIPVKENRSLKIFFPLPFNIEKDYLTQQSKYYSHLLGHEGVGSLLNYLKDEGLATGLSCGAEKEFHTEELFLIEISLTVEGESKKNNFNNKFYNN